ncbi:MAG: extracellular solute-binding protein [Vulcanimicrobiota bacterium]
MRWLIGLLLFLWGAAPLWARPSEIEVTLFEGGEGLEFYTRAAEEFQRMTGVETHLQGDPAMADRMRMRVLEGSYPEVSNANIDIWNLIEHEKILPLDAWLDEPLPGGGTWRESFLPGSLNQYSKDGKTYGAPLVYVVWSVYYNKAVFRRYGLNPPDTWEQLLELCQTISEHGETPIAFQGRYSFYAQPLVEHTYFQLAGAENFQKLQAAEPGAFEHEAMVKALGLLDQLARDYFSKGFQGMSHTEAQLEFFQGRAAMLFCGSWLYSEMQDNIPQDFELGAFALPVPTSPQADPGLQYASSGYFFVFQDSANPEQGVRFLQHLTSPEVASRFAGERGIPVAVRDANQHLHPMMAPVALQLEEIRDTFGPRSGPTLAGLSQVWTDNLNLILQGTASPREVAGLMERQAQEVRAAAHNPDRVEVRHRGKTLLFLLFLVSGAVVGATSFNRGGVLSSAAMNSRQVAPFVLPSLLVFTLFFALPSLVALAGCLVRWDGVGKMEWVGLLHLKRMLLESDLFWLSLGHNLILMLVPALFAIPLALLLAYLLKQKVVGARFFRIAFFFPNLIGVAGILLWQQLYNPQIGPVNELLVSLGFSSFEGFAWLSSQNLYYALIPMAVWAAAGFNMVLFLAAMQSVPETLYEAAEVHGAGEWEKFRFITLPLIRDTVAVAAVLMVIGGMKAFEAIWLLTNQQPTSETHVVGTFMIRSLFVEQKIGQAAALACLLFAIVLVGSLYASKIAEEKR